MRVAYILPRCLPQNSHGRYVIELTRRLDTRVSIEIFSGGFSNGSSRHTSHFLPVLNRPAAARLAMLWAGSMLTSPSRFDIVHTQGADAPVGNIVTATYCNAAEAERRRSHVSDQTEGSARRRLMNQVGARAEAYCLARATAVIAVSNAVKDEIVRHYDVEADRISVIHYGVDLEEFNPRRRVDERNQVRQGLRLPAKSFVVLFVGGDYRRKGLLPLIEAVHLVGRDSIHIVAVGVQRDHCLAAAIEQFKVEGRIHFVDTTARTSGYYAAADAFALPTRYDTFSLATLEAMASGVPVIVSRDAGVVEIITDGVDGLVLPHRWDSHALARRLAILAGEPEASNRLGERARNTAEHHSWDLMAEKTMDVYSRVADGRAGKN